MSNKLAGKWTQIYYAGYDLSGWSHQFDATIEVDEIDGTAFLDGAKNSFDGLPGGSAAVEAFLSTGAGESEDGLSTYVPTYTDYHLQILVGQNAAPAIGDPVFMLTAKQFDYKVPLSVATAVLIQSTFKQQTKPYWGTVHANTSITNTTGFASVDGKMVSSANGAEATLEIITALASDTYVIKVQHSTNDVDWVDLMTFTADGSARTSERQTVTGTINRYTRALATRTGSGQTLRLAVAVVRL